MEMPVASFSPDLDTDTASFGGPNTLGGDGRHPAIDIVDSRKTPISSVAYGVVVDVLDVENQDFGRHVVVEHDVDGVRFYSVYAHLDKILVAEGNIVDANTQIGLMGNSPSALNMSDHLHFEVRTETNVIQDPTGEYSSFPRGHESYWANNPQELRENWVDLGQIFGYHSTFSAWQETFTN